MRVLLTILHLLAGLGLLAAPCLSRVGPAGVGDAPSWSSAPVEIAPLGRSERAQLDGANPDEVLGAVGKGAGGNEPLDAAPARTWQAPARHGAVRGTGATGDDRASLGQRHLRVNGSADACGARA